MRYFILMIAVSPLLGTAFAQEITGKTANGCSYRIINGQYLTTCDEQKAAAPEQPQMAAAAPAAAPVVTSYDAVPVRQNFAAPQPAVNAQPEPARPAIPVQTSAIVVPQSTYQERRQEQRDQFVDATYVGGAIGSSTITESNAGSSTGFGVALGTNLDDFLGIELGYAYTNQDQNLGLAARAGSPQAPGASDASLRSHLISAEIQAHLTDIFKRLRPYAGLGLAWKSSTLEEEAQPALYPSYGLPNAKGGSIEQTSLGAIASAGTKFRLTQTLQLGVAFRYFLPLSRQAARLSEGGTRLTQADARLTGSSQHQFSGGLFYAF